MNKNSLRVSSEKMDTKGTSAKLLARSPSFQHEVCHIGFFACSTRYRLQNSPCILHLAKARSSAMSFAEVS
jgi:hypothetical protein